MGFPHQIPRGTVKVHDAGRGCLNAHFMFDRTASNRVTIAKRSVITNHEFRHKEQGYALGSFGGIGQFCQYQMDDVFRQVMFTSGYENLCAGDRIRPIIMWFGLGFDDAKIRTAMWFGQAHGARPSSIDHLGQEFVF